MLLGGHARGASESKVESARQDLTAEISCFTIASLASVEGGDTIIKPLEDLCGLQGSSVNAEYSRDVRLVEEGVG